MVKERNFLGFGTVVLGLVCVHDLLEVVDLGAELREHRLVVGHVRQFEESLFVCYFFMSSLVVGVDYVYCR
jgi:hypothetical protein